MCHCCWGRITIPLTGEAKLCGDFVIWATMAMSVAWSVTRRFLLMGKRLKHWRNKDVYGENKRQFHR